eukprot:4348226-Heterocapsa_arctica.AAC.1
MGKDGGRKKTSTPAIRTGVRSSGSLTTPSAAVLGIALDESQEQSPHKKTRGGDDDNSMATQFQELS